MSLFVLPKGTLKVIVFDAGALAENAERRRAGGKVFRPFVLVAERSAGGSVQVHGAFGFKLATVRMGYAPDHFPYKWAPRAFHEHRAFFYTTGELPLFDNPNDVRIDND